MIGGLLLGSSCKKNDVNPNSTSNSEKSNTINSSSLAEQSTISKNRLKSDSGPFSLSLSNMAESELTGVAQPQIVPDPVSTKKFISFSPIDASIEINGFIYLFKNNLVLKYDIANDITCAGYPRPITLDFKNLTGWQYLYSTFLGGIKKPTGPFVDFSYGIEAALNMGNGKVYLFKNGTTLELDMFLRGVKCQKISETFLSFPSLPMNIDAAVNTNDGFINFYSGDSYYAYNIATKVSNVIKINSTFNGITSVNDACYSNNKLTIFNGAWKYRYYKASQYTIMDKTENLFLISK